MWLVEDMMVCVCTRAGGLSEEQCIIVNGRKDGQYQSLYVVSGRRDEECTLRSGRSDEQYTVISGMRSLSKFAHGKVY